MESFSDLLNKKEELREELKLYLENNGTFDLIRHPLVYSVPHHESQNALVNKQYEVRKKYADDILNKKEYAEYIFLHEKPFRMDAFVEVKDKLNDEHYWSIAAEVWTNSDNIWQNKKTWKKLLTDKKRIATKTLFMSYDELKEFNDLPKEFTVYRGYHEGINEEGFSYTLDKSVAERLTKAHKKIGKVLSRVVSKDKIFAYTNKRNESEIIII